MNEMVDRAVRAWLVKANEPAPNVLLFDELYADQLENVRECMRAAIAALREPTEAMCRAGLDHYAEHDPYDSPLGPDGSFAGQWRAMIDESLK